MEYHWHQHLALLLCTCLGMHTFWTLSKSKALLHIGMHAPPNHTYSGARKFVNPLSESLRDYDLNVTRSLSKSSKLIKRSRCNIYSLIYFFIDQMIPNEMTIVLKSI